MLKGYAEDLDPMKPRRYKSTSISQNSKRIPNFRITCQAQTKSTFDAETQSKLRS
ncbi:Protein of unknown function [Pyronema omphalodes CBS 100304]|uniref:Uncharacterized protein n=1 Tax=Pyronema omphalodes (strain CBS 100304) TaxID=1076935 RepID=U4LNU5_PYROM|nr:Protein of unknown function [Pyronema omphalodes CBS 100304]